MLNFIRNLGPNYIFIIGVIIGAIISKLIARRRVKVGVLRIDRSDPEKDLYKIELEDLEKLKYVKEVVLKIDNNSDLSQK